MHAAALSPYILRAFPPQAMGIDGFMLEDPTAITLDVPEHARYGLAS